MISRHRALWIFLIIITLLRVFYASRLGLGDDEAYYWEWGMHPALSYHDHPPMTAWLVRAGCAVFGGTEWGVRFFAVAGSLLFTVLCYLLALRLYQRRRTAFLFAVFISFVPIFAAGAFMMVPDAPLSVFWTASLYVFLRIIETKKKHYWYALGVLSGLGLLSKYNMALFPLCALTYCTLSPGDRFWLKRREPYLALCIGCALFSPVIIWNASHGFSSFVFQFAGRHSYGLSWTPFVIYLAGQLGYLSPFVFAAALAVMALFTRRVFRRTVSGPVPFLFSFSVPYFVLFSAACSLSPTSKPHWPVLGYLPALLYCTRKFESWMVDRGMPHRALKLAYGWTAAGVSALLCVFLYVQSMYPVLRLAGNADATNELYGWDTVGRELDRRMAGTGGGSTGAPEFIFAVRYNIASQVAFYTKNRWPVYSVNPKREQQDVWGRGRLDGLEGKSGLFVHDERYRHDLTKDYIFETVGPADTVTVFRGGRPVKRVFITPCFNLLGPAGKPYIFRQGAGQ